LIADFYEIKNSAALQQQVSSGTYKTRIGKADTEGNEKRERTSEETGHDRLNRQETHNR